MEVLAVKDTHTWSVTYHDDTRTPEFDELRPGGRGFAEIDKPSVKALDLDTADLLGKHRVLIPEGAEPVFFRRRTIAVNLDTEQEQGRSTVHCIGWKRGDDACYLFIFEDGSALLTSDLNAV